MFRRAAESGRVSTMTVNGRAQVRAEGPGAIQRRVRLFVECERRLADDPLAREGVSGAPLGDGHGLEGLVAKITPLFEFEPSLLRWVALRGALAELFIRIIDRESAARSRTDLETAMGLEWLTQPNGESQPDLAVPWRTEFVPEHRQAALGVAGFVLIRADDYPRYAALSVLDVNTDAYCRTMSHALALDTIAWSAIALLRLGVAQQLFDQVPEPDALHVPGWYPEPLFTKSERYWDGSDWTAACRVPDGRRYVETSVPLN